MSHEKSFFQQIASATSPGWDVHLKRHMQPGSMNLSEHSARIYAVDVRSGWIGAGCMVPRAMLEAAQQLKARNLSGGPLQDEAGHWVSNMGSADIGSDNPDIEKCLTVVAAALTETSTFTSARPQGLEGHWIFMVYTCMDSSLVSRPVFGRNSLVGGAFLEPRTLYSLIARVITQDHTPESNVAKQLALGQGTDVAEAFGGPRAEHHMRPLKPRTPRP